jgi:hypothetical protein
MTLHITSNGGERSARPALTPKGQATVALIRLERVLEHLTEAELVDLVSALQPIVRVARSRAEGRQSPPASTLLIASFTV